MLSVAAALTLSTATLTTADVQHKQQSSYGGDCPEQVTFKKNFKKEAEMMLVLMFLI